ncbi:MAG: AsmA family protein [Azonexus sp.]|jgi:AsmA protein|uniref:AsmA family protein n=1 Tax=Azonexus sp. TaxID=1872668 RepID=UPI002831B97C|nr:AsmA family protein [Azonexus sp.]MDR0775155.1 AsmA family protein [Azonexus sp.]
MKIRKILAWGLAGLVTVLAVVTVFIAATFDANRWKGEITQLVQEKTQRSLKIEGDLALSFFPSISVRLGQATLSERQSEQVFASLEGARISLRLWPLLAKRVVVDSVELDGIKAKLVRSKDGRMNIDDLLGVDEKSEKDDAPMPRFELAGVRIINGEFGWRDEEAGQELTISALNLKTGRLANAASDRFDLSLQLSSKNPLLAAQFAAKGEYRYDLDQKNVALAKLDLHLTGDAAEMKGLDLALTATALQLGGAGEVSVDGLALTVQGKAAGDPFAAKLEAPRLELAADQASGAAAHAMFKLNGAQRQLEAKIALTGLEGKGRILRIGKLAIDFDARQGDMRLKGALTSPVTANLEKQILELPDLNGKLDESAIAAKLHISRFSPLALGFDVDIDQLNIDKYLPPKKAAPGKGGGQPAAESSIDSPLDFSALKGLSANGVLKVGQLQAANVKASQVRLEIKLANGRLDLAPTAQLYNGSLAGTLSLDANTNQVAAKLNLVDVSLNPLMQDALDMNALEGRGSLALDITTAGNTVTAMKKGLAGTASLNVRNGAIKGIDLARTFRETKALFSTRKDASQKARQTDKTDFSELTASFRIARGVARNDDLSMKSPFIRLTGAGDIDIGEGRINYLARATVVPTAGGQGGKDLEYLSGITIPVRLSGPFDNLSYNLEFASLTAEAAKAKAKEVTGKAGSAIKGLFKK